MVAVNHRIAHGAGRPWVEGLTRRGWRLHEYLSTPAEARAEVPMCRFTPWESLSPSTHDSMLGITFPAGDGNADDLILRRLDPRDRLSPRQEPLLLTLERADSPPFGPLLELDGDGRLYRFAVEWVDLWVFESGFGLLTLKTRLNGVAEEDKLRIPRIGDLGRFNGLLRELEGGDAAPAMRAAGSEGSWRPFWETLLQTRLGLSLDGRNRCFDGDNLLLLEAGTPWRHDRYTRYAKLLTAARISAPGEGEPSFRWSCPFSEPPVDPARACRALAGDDWSVELTGLHNANMAGYPSLGDALLYELASTSCEGGALGSTAAPHWRVSPEYLRRVFDDCAIEIWEFWQGLVLRDTCAFLAWDAAMPILHQAEQRYYPLYVHAYLCQCRLHALSEAIIDHDLHDARNAREIRNRFHAFRNQFWFRETATGFQGIEVAERMKRGMGLERLYESVAAEVEEVGKFVDDKIRSGRQALIALLVAGFYPVSFAWESFGLGEKVRALGAADPDLALRVGMGGVAVILLLGFLLARHATVILRRLSDWMWRRDI